LSLGLAARASSAARGSVYVSAGSIVACQNAPRNHDHPDAIEAALAARAAGAWETQLKQRLGEADYARLTGASAHA